ncbi:MAG: hypothetical protein WBS18_07235 [Candidatus Acidiferrales bacterium]
MLQTDTANNTRQLGQTVACNRHNMRPHGATSFLTLLIFAASTNQAIEAQNRHGERCSVGEFLLVVPSDTNRTGGKR